MTLAGTAAESLATKADAYGVASDETRLTWRLLAGRGTRAGLPAILARPSTTYLSLARHAIFHGLGVLGIKQGQTVLVPAYHCAAFVEPILAFGARVVFYKVGLDCMPDLVDVSRKVDAQTRAIVAVHYFGFEAPIDRLKELCEAHQLFLIEDCAHVLVDSAAGRALGSHGHISVFSFRKFLPLHEGACLVNNTEPGAGAVTLRAAGWRHSLRMKKHLMEKLCVDSGGLAATLANGVQAGLKRMKRTLPCEASTTDGVPILKEESPSFDSSLADQPMAYLSQRVLQNSAVSRIVEQRRANYKHLLQATAGLAGITPLFPCLPTGTCPWVFPVMSSLVKDLHKQLRARGVAAAAWDGVIHPSLPIAHFPEAAQLYANLIFLPLHQDLSFATLDAMVDVLTSVISLNAQKARPS
jgi:dTDP-4-amino-4,6-dideoxygalactose transaminase